MCNIKKESSKNDETSEIKEWFTAIGPDHMAHANLYNEVAYEFYNSILMADENRQPMAVRSNQHWDKSHSRINANMHTNTNAVKRYGDPSSVAVVPRNKIDKIRKGR